MPAINDPIRTCLICKGPINKNNKWGICQRNRNCCSEHTRKVQAQRKGIPYKPHRYCKGCGNRLHYNSKNEFCRKNAACRNEFLADRYERNRVKPDFYEINALERAKIRAKKRNQPFDISLENLPPIPSHCPALGIELSTTNTITKSNSVSLDCINPSLGYVLGNVQWLSFKANSMKRDATPEELRRFAQWILTN